MEICQTKMNVVVIMVECLADYLEETDAAVEVTVKYYFLSSYSYFYLQTLDAAVVAEDNL